MTPRGKTTAPLIDRLTARRSRLPHPTAWEKETVRIPLRTETTDGHDVVAWLREQPWYPGTFATFGHSYLGYTQWAILADPPEDLVASVVMEGPHDFSRHAWGTGSFHYDIFGWAEMVRMIHHHSPRDLLAALRGRTARNAAVSAVPVLPAADAAFKDVAPRNCRTLTCSSGSATWMRAVGPPMSPRPSGG